MASVRAIGTRLFSIVFIVAVVAVVAYFALKAVPSAQRPTLRDPAKAHSSQHR